MLKINNQCFKCHSSKNVKAILFECRFLYEIGWLGIFFFKIAGLAPIDHE
jgi:hypothetical protein